MLNHITSTDVLHMSTCRISSTGAVLASRFARPIENDLVLIAMVIILLIVAAIVVAAVAIWIVKFRVNGEVSVVKQTRDALTPLTCIF